MNDSLRLFVCSPGQATPCAGEAVYPSVQAALAAAVDAHAAHVELVLAPGRHYFDAPVEFGPLPSPIASLTIRGSGEKQTELTGAVPIQPQWEPYRDGILVAQIGPGRAVDSLYVNDCCQVMARYPNQQPGVVLQGYSADATSPERVARWKNPEGGYIRALHFSEWGSNSYIIDGKNEDNTLRCHWVGDNNRGCQMHTIKRMVENIFEELDEPREWFYDRKTGELFYWPEEGLDLATAKFEIVSTEEIFRLVGTQEIPVRNVTFENLRILRTHRTLFTRPYERPLRGDWGMVRAGAIYLENTEQVVIRDCDFFDIGGNGIMLSGYNRDDAVLHCDFEHVGATGVLLMGRMSAVRDPSTYDGDNHKTTISDFHSGPKTEEYPRDIRIADNYFYDIGTFEKQTAAVCMSISARITVAKNTVHHTSRAGINIHDGTFGGHVIEDNDLFDCVTETADHGPINCWGRDRYWSVPQHDAMGYYGQVKRPFALLDAVETTTIRHNRVSANYAFGIDIDDGSSNYHIYDNLCIGVGIKLRDGFDRRVHNNLLVGSGFEQHMTFAQNNDLIYNNVVFNSKAYNRLCINEGATTICANNLYWNMGNPISGLPEEEYAAEVADPLFTDLDGNDFTLRPESPALARGFVNFPMRDADFGRPDKPKPPLYVYASTDDDETYLFHDVLLANVTNEGIRSAAGLPDRKGVYIADRDVLGLFCKLGLPIGVGDVIRQIGDAEIACIDDFLREFANIPLETPTRIVIYRSQRPQAFDFIKQTNDYQSICDEATAAWLDGAPMLYKHED